MRSFERLHPQETHEKGGGYFHRLELSDGGKHIGYAALEYHNDPVPTYYVENINVDQALRGRHYGGDILRQINSFLREKRTSGILVNTIKSNNPAQNMYTEHGWEPVEGKSGWYTFNMPQHLNAGHINKMIYEIEESAVRASGARDERERKAA